MRSKAEAIWSATIVRVDNTTYEIVGTRLVSRRHTSVTQARRHVMAVLKDKGGHCVVGETALAAVRKRIKSFSGDPK